MNNRNGDKFLLSPYFTLKSIATGQIKSHYLALIISKSPITSSHIAQ